MVSYTYTEEALRKVFALKKVETFQKGKLPSSPGDHPKLHLSPLLGNAQYCIYQKLVVMKEWMVQIGSFEIRFSVTSLNRLSAAPC